jgi:hypothetical protein
MSETDESLCYPETSNENTSTTHPMGPLIRTFTKVLGKRKGMLPDNPILFIAIPSPLVDLRGIHRALQSEYLDYKDLIQRGLILCILTKGTTARSSVTQSALRMALTEQMKTLESERDNTTPPRVILTQFNSGVALKDHILVIVQGDKPETNTNLANEIIGETTQALLSTGEGTLYI